MKLLLDQNISFRVAAQLKEFFPQTEGVKKLGLTDKDDLEIWKFAKENNYTVVTKDSDFSAFATYYGAPPKIIWIRKPNLSNKEFVDLMIVTHNLILDFITDLESEKSLLEIY